MKNTRSKSLAIACLMPLIISASEPEPEPETDAVFVNFMTNQGSGANANAMTQEQADAMGAEIFVNVDVQGTGSQPRTWNDVGGVSGSVYYADWWQDGMKSALYDGGENPDQGFTGGVVGINGTHSAPNPESRSSTVTLDVGDFISDRGLSGYHVRVYYAGRQEAGGTALTNSENRIVRIHDGTAEQTDYAQHGVLVEGAFWSGRGALFSFPASTETLTITTDSVGGTTQSGIAGVMILPGETDGDPPAMVVETAGPESVDALATEGFSFSAVDPEGGMVEIQVDWGDGTIAEWSDPVPSGQAVVFSRAFRQAGTYTVRARARGANGVPSEWVEIQQVSVAPPEGALDGLVGLWEFADGDDIGRATYGFDLDIVGSEPSHEETRADGRDLPFSLDGVITTVHGVPNHLVATHNIGASGGGSRSNEYTLVFDVLVPGTGEWRCFYQTDPTNASNNDGEYFVRNSDNSLGRASISYGPPAAENRWMRLVITADLAESGFFRTYIDGALHHNHSKPALDSDFSLDPSELLLFADNDGENHPLVVSKVAMVDRALDAAEVELLGGPGLSLIVPEGNTAPELIAQTAGPTTAETGEPETYNFTATDAEGDRVQVQVDWGDGTFSDWTTFVDSGEAVPAQQSFSLPGVFTIHARARDIHGAVSDWVEIQEVTVTGEADITILTPPYLQNMDTDRMVVMVEVEEEVALAIEYGPTPALGQSVPTTSVASGRPATSSFTTESYFHRGTITGLEPGTTYYYRVAGPGGGGITDISTFRTAPSGWGDFSFMAIGDLQRNNQFRGIWAWEEDPWEPGKAMLQHMTTRGPSFLLGLGDHASDGNRYDRTRPAHLERVCAIFGTYAPFFIAWGNHDGNSPTHPLRLSADMPSRFRTDSLSTFTSGFGSFAFEHSGVFYVCLEHFTCFTGTHTFITNAANNDITNGWLDSVLSSPAARNARFRIVAIHVPPYCERWINGNQGLRNHLVPRLEQYKVDMCMSGHMHGYERGRINGVQYVISGGGSYLDIGEPLVANWSAATDDGLWLGGHVDVEGEYAMQSSLGVLGDPEPIEGGLFHGYSEITVRDRYLRLDQHGFNADGSYIGILDTIEINGPDPGPDSNGDGMRDAWKIVHGLDPFDDTGDNSPNADLDGDGMTNLEEYIAGTDPRDPQSRFTVDKVTTLGEDTVLLRWRSVPGRRYHIETSTDLLNWQRVEEMPDVPETFFGEEESDFTEVEVVLPPHADERLFFRVEVTL